MGFAKGKTKLDKKTKLLITEQMKLAKKLIRAKQAVSYSKIVSRTPPDKIYLEPGFVLKSKDLYKLFRNSKIVYGFAVTIGPLLEAKRNALMAEKESARAVILDAIGSVAVEDLAEAANNSIKLKMQNKNGTTTRRFSPGYGDWRIQNQKEFLKWLGAQEIGIKLTPSYQMVPEKSLTAVIGTT